MARVKTPRIREADIQEFMESSQSDRAMAPAVRVVAMGVSGAGKSTIGALIAEALNYQFLDGSALHPLTNVRKMAAGVPLGEAERLAWLDVVGNELADSTARGLVIACSARKRKYRDALRAKVPDVIFVHLAAPLEVLSARLEGRSGRPVPLKVLAAQMAALEPLEEDEHGVVVDISDGIAAVLDQGVAGIRKLAGH